MAAADLADWSRFARGPLTNLTLIGCVSGIDMCSDVTDSSKLYFMVCVPDATEQRHGGGGGGSGGGSSAAGGVSGLWLRRAVRMEARVAVSLHAAAHRRTEAEEAMPALKRRRSKRSGQIGQVGGGQGNFTRRPL